MVFDEEIDHKGISSKGSVLLRNVVRVEDIEDPIAVGQYSVFRKETLAINFLFAVEDILARTDPLTLQKIYNLPTFGSTLEFLTMLSLTTGRLLKVPIFLVSVYMCALIVAITGWDTRHPHLRSACSNRLESSKNPLFLCPARHTSFFCPFFRACFLPSIDVSFFCFKYR